jgi:hypothetical protein
LLRREREPGKGEVKAMDPELVKEKEGEQEWREGLGQELDQEVDLVIEELSKSKKQNHWWWRW